MAKAKLIEKTKGLWLHGAAKASGVAFLRQKSNTSVTELFLSRKKIPDCDTAYC